MDNNHGKIMENNSINLYCRFFIVLKKFAKYW